MSNNTNKFICCCRDSSEDENVCNCAKERKSSHYKVRKRKMILKESAMAASTSKDSERKSNLSQRTKKDFETEMKRYKNSCKNKDSLIELKFIKKAMEKFENKPHTSDRKTKRKYSHVNADSESSEWNEEGSMSDYHDTTKKINLNKLIIGKKLKNEMSYLIKIPDNNAYCKTNREHRMVKKNDDDYLLPPENFPGEEKFQRVIELDEKQEKVKPDFWFKTIRKG